MLIQADARHIPLKGESVQCVVTSPPYWGLRSNQGTELAWGGDPKCPHRWEEKGQPFSLIRHGLSGSTLQDGTEAWGKRELGSYGEDCLDCGAWLGQLGAESALELYIQHLVEIFREVKRVLRKNGVVWIVIGDNYARAGGWSDNSGLDGLKRGQSGRAMSNLPTDGGLSQKVPLGLKSKDLVGIPWMVAFALRSDGWYLRRDVIWWKFNVRPESVTDRPTTAHEYVFLLTKSSRYYYDFRAILEPVVSKPRPGRKKGRGTEGWQIASGFRNVPQLFSHKVDSAGKNLRSVWAINTKGFPGAHFSTFPPALVETCILLGSPPGGIVLDPFVGSGTTLLVARRLNRIGVGLDLAYQSIARERLAPVYGKVLWCPQCGRVASVRGTRHVCLRCRVQAQRRSWRKAYGQTY